MQQAEKRCSRCLEVKSVSEFYKSRGSYVSPCKTCIQIRHKKDYAKNGEPLGNDTHIDHCHKTGAIRGLIHSRCNRVLGKAISFT